MLHVDARLAEVPGCSTEQLESLARSIEHKKQRLEADINAYTSQKQHELQMFQQKLIAQYREMECGETQDEPANRPDRRADSQAASAPARSAEPLPRQSPETSSEPKREDKAKRTKVHKREKELFGLVTPIFLPLLDASDTSRDREKKKRQKKKEGTGSSSPPKQSDSSASPGDAEQKQESRGPLNQSGDRMEPDLVTAPPLKENQTPEPAKKSKRPAIKKSSLRHSGEKRRRKRVSLVIDGQTVLPADTVSEPQLMSPTETTASSTSNSTISLQDTIDPRLIGREDAPFYEHHDPMHHSIDLPSHLPSTSPTKHTGHHLPYSPIHSPMYQSPPSHAHLEYEPPQTATQTYLTPSPTSDPSILPQYASAAPIYASEPELADALEGEFSTYVGGISGSGVDDLDQTGSLGYPSSLGASYMESYMQSRPLSVRMAAAEKAGLSNEERRRLISGRHKNEEEEEGDGEADTRGALSGGVDEDMEIIGSMEDF